MRLLAPVRRAILPALAMVGGLACQSGDAPVREERAAQERPAPPEKPKAAAGDVAFDPANPPPGWIQCHRNHCHHEDGRVASYAQVMQEIGATRIIGEAPPKAAPSAPADVAAPPADAKKTKTGLASRLLKAGQGTRKPGPTSIVTVHYTGWTTDGKPFDSSIPRGRPAQFPLGKVVAGWTEGIQLMVEGEERRFWIPEALAYKGAPGKPAGVLVFDVELISIR